MQFVVLVSVLMVFLISPVHLTELSWTLEGRKLFVKNKEDSRTLLDENDDTCTKLGILRVNLLGVYKSVTLRLYPWLSAKQMLITVRLSMDGEQWKECSKSKNLCGEMAKEPFRWIEVTIPKSENTCELEITGTYHQDDYNAIPKSDIDRKDISSLFDGDKEKSSSVKLSSSSPIIILLNRPYMITLMRFYIQGTSSSPTQRSIKVEYETNNGMKLFGSFTINERDYQMIDFGGFLNSEVAKTKKIQIKIDGAEEFKGSINEIQLLGAPYLPWQWEKLVASGDNKELVRNKSDSIYQCFTQCLWFKYFYIFNESTCDCREDTHITEQTKNSTVVFSPPEIIGCLPPRRVQFYNMKQMQLGESDTTHTCFKYCSFYDHVGINGNKQCLCLEVKDDKLETMKAECGISCELSNQMLCLSNTGTLVIKIKGMKLDTMQNSSDKHVDKMSYRTLMTILLGTTIPGCVVLFCVTVGVTVYCMRRHEKRKRYGLVPTATTSSSISELRRSAPPKPKKVDPDEPYLPYRIVPLPRPKRDHKPGEPSHSPRRDERRDRY